MKGVKSIQKNIEIQPGNHDEHFVIVISYNLHRKQYDYAVLIINNAQSVNYYKNDQIKQSYQTYVPALERSNVKPRTISSLILSLVLFKSISYLHYITKLRPNRTYHSSALCNVCSAPTAVQRLLIPDRS